LAPFALFALCSWVGSLVALVSQVSGLSCLSCLFLSWLPWLSCLSWLSCFPFVALSSFLPFFFSMCYDNAINCYRMFFMCCAFFGPQLAGRGLAARCHLVIHVCVITLAGICRNMQTVRMRATVRNRHSVAASSAVYCHRLILPPVPPSSHAAPFPRIPVYFIITHDPLLSAHLPSSSIYIPSFSRPSSWCVCMCVSFFVPGRIMHRLAICVRVRDGGRT
jgi:hypothetical protein